MEPRAADVPWRAGLAVGLVLWVAVAVALLTRATSAERGTLIALFVLVVPLAAAIFSLGFAQFDKPIWPAFVRGAARFLAAALIAPMALAVLALPKGKRPPADAP